MEFKFSKNNIGIFVTLLLVILLSQSSFLNFFIDTYFGRFIFVFLILGISYINKIFGVIGILFLIIMFNQSDIGYIEGFTDGETTNAHLNNIKTIKEKKMTAIKNKINTTTTTTEPTTTTTEPTEQTTTTTEPTEPTTTTTESTETFSGREGFNIIDREGSILKGKRSNEVPVFNDTRRQTDNIEPVDKSVFSNNYSLI